jgi:hypothetical protein
MRVVSLEDLERGTGLIPQNWNESERLAFFDDRVQACRRDPRLAEVVAAILAPIDTEDARAVLAALLAAVQDWVVFTPDRRGRDTWQAPRVTFLQRTGDCEDMAMLLVALVRIARGRVGLPLAARLVWLRQEGRDLDHVSAQVSDVPRIERVGDRTQGVARIEKPQEETPVVLASEATGEAMAPWLWAETTVAAALGENPYRALQRLRGGRVEAVLGRVLGGDS